MSCTKQNFLRVREHLALTRVSHYIKQWALLSPENNLSLHLVLLWTVWFLRFCAIEIDIFLVQNSQYCLNHFKYPPATWITSMKKKKRKILESSLHKVPRISFLVHLCYISSFIIHIGNYCHGRKGTRIPASWEMLLCKLSEVLWL